MNVIGHNPLHIGMRKIKSILVLIVVFAVWQVIRSVIPKLEVHPIYAYIYAVIEMRETTEKTKIFGIRRIIVTIIGLGIGLLFIFFSNHIVAEFFNPQVKFYVDFILILIATLLSLCIAETLHCENFCGLAAVITIIFMVAHTDDKQYIYAIMRILQTVMGVCIAFIINKYVSNPQKRKNGGGT